jgi:hypothetical protein
MQSIISRKNMTICNSNSPKESTNNKKFIEKQRSVFSKFHDKRNQTVKKNFNQFIATSQAELKEIDVFLKELDVFHKEQFDMLKKMVNREKNDAENSEDDIEKTESVEDNKDNIFLEN